MEHHVYSWLQPQPSHEFGSDELITVQHMATPISEVIDKFTSGMPIDTNGLPVYEDNEDDELNGFAPDIEECPTEFNESR